MALLFNKCTLLHDEWKFIFIVLLIVLTANNESLIDRPCEISSSINSRQINSQRDSKITELRIHEYLNQIRKSMHEESNY